MSSVDQDAKATVRARIAEIDAQVDPHRLKESIVIEPIGQGIRVRQGDAIGGEFLHLKSLQVHNGKPLYIAILPRFEQSFWGIDALVYGTKEYRGAQHIEKVFGFIDDEPVYLGRVEEHDSSYAVIVGDLSGRRPEFFEKISEEVDIEFGMPIYAAKCYDGTWQAMIGTRSFGPYESEPKVGPCTEAESGGLPRFKIEGVWRGKPHELLISVEEVLNLPIDKMHSQGVPVVEAPPAPALFQTRTPASQ